MTVLDSIRRALVPYEAPTIKAEIIEQKAATGAGAWVMENRTPLNAGWGRKYDSGSFMRKAQEISHRSPWVATAERIISGKVGTVPWHLEDADEEDITADAATADFRRLMERPNPRMTRRVLWQLTSRHLGVCGNAFWYLDQRSRTTNEPLAIYYINPVRMTPSADKGGNLTGWMLDAENQYDWGMGVPLELDEVLHFVFEPPDWGHFGHGLVEAAMSKIEVERYADAYASGVLAAGGKRGGIATPKDGILPTEVYNAVVASFRNVAEAADATKRTIVTQGALDYHFTSATPQEIGLDGLMSLTRDDILGIWGVPLSAAGITTSRGLNSGETQKYEEAALWQNGIHTRIVAITETLQYQLLDRINPDWQLIIEEPEFDDQQPLFQLADLAKTQPMKNIERRTLLGLDPFGDERDEEVWLPKGYVRIYPEPEDAGPVPPLVPVRPGPSDATEAEDQQDAEDDAEEAVREAKATVAPLTGLRSKIERTDQVAMQADVEKFLADQRDAILERLRSRVRHFMQKPKDAAAMFGKDWDAELAKVLIPAEEAIATETAAGVRKVVAKKADPFEEDAIEFVRTRTGERITGINGTTRDAVLSEVRAVIDAAVRQGLGPSEVAGNLTDRVGGLTVWNADRANLIARTETMFAYNDAALKSYEKLDVSQVEALDGDKDAECNERNGRLYPIADAYNIADHPNGTLDWMPVLKASTDLEVWQPATIKARPVVQPTRVEMGVPQITLSPTFHFDPANITVNVPEQPAPVVNVSPEAPLINVNVPRQEPPVVNVEAQKASTDGVVDVRVVEDTSLRVKRVYRDDKGRIEGVVEGKP